MNTTESIELEFEIIIGVDSGPGADTAVERLGAVLDQVADPIVLEQWQPPPVRGPMTQLLLTSLGVVSLSRSSVAGMRAVLNEVVTAFDGTGEAQRITLEIGDEVVSLADVTPAMIESWLPPV